MPEHCDELARLERLESLGRRRPVYRTEKGILKVCGSPHEAVSEARSLEMARETIGRHQRVPRLRELSGNLLLIEDVGPDPLTTERHVQSAAEYLASIHQTEINQSLIDRLEEGRFHHYWKEYLLNRLRREVALSQRGNLPGEQTERFRAATEIVANVPLPLHSHVVGHGDPRAMNFVVGDGQEPCAVDWKDFGLSNRWYEIAHFVNSLEEGHRDAAIAAYRVRAGLTDFAQWELAHAYGVAVSSVIRVGTVARNARTENHKSSRSFTRSVARLQRAIDSLMNQNWA
ncbi:MAG: aminoglycoside phosphotransferase family protein [Deltaproteobacteria bacterium]|nr:aminoglycoside phosphotransferase family protein [Deltaproteobacteria bacterium]